MGRVSAQSSQRRDTSLVSAPTTRTILSFRLWRIVTAVAFGVGLGFALYLFSASGPTWTDGEAYWQAGVRVRAGESVYAGEMGTATYRYAPWFAWAWAPLTMLPKALVTAAWQVAMVGCAFAAILPALRSPFGRAVAAFSLPLLLVNAIGGNVQPALVAMLVYLPWSTGVGASLKPLAVALLAVDAWRGRWGRVAVGVAVAGVLWAPALLDPSGYPAPRGIGHYDLTLLLAAIPRLAAQAHDAELR